MRTDRIMVALALAMSTASAAAGTVCVQNKLTGKYEPKNPTAGNVADCAVMNQAATVALAQQAEPAHPAAPVPPAVRPVVITPPPPVPVDPAKQVRTYRLKFSDVTVRLGMKRWLKETGMQLAYEAQKDFPVPVEGDYTGPISDVMLKLMTSLSESSYPLRACEYDNRVLLIVHRDDKCPLEDQQ